MNPIIRLQLGLQKIRDCIAYNLFRLIDTILILLNALKLRSSYGALILYLKTIILQGKH